MATSSGHTIKAFDEDLDRLRALISQMGGLAEHAIRESMRCLVQRDLEGAEKIVENDKKLDALEIETEKQVVRLIALRAPMADDLRDVVAALKISSVVERDRAVDDFYNSIFRALLTFMMENPNNIGQSTHLLFVAKNIERVGDHATNIAEMVYFAASGEHLADRPRGHSPLDPQ